jgi:hypothetical protein
LRLVMLGALALMSTGSRRTIADEVSAFEAQKKLPPMEFFIAKGGPNACGAGCDSWIAAEGRIVRDSVGADGRPEEGTAARLISLLSRLGGRKLPIFFHSPGGDTIEALALGRALRAWQLRAGVAATLPAKCAAGNAEDCRKSMHEHPDAEAKLWSDGASCNSACAYAILGAVGREIAPDAKVGVHKFFLDPSVAEARRAQLMPVAERRVQRYVADMGIDAGFYKIASAIDFESVHVLTRSELFDLGVDRRETFDTGWTEGNIDSRSGYLIFAAAAAKIESAGSDKSATTFEKITLVINCDKPRDTYVVAVWQQLTDASAKTIEDIRVGSGAAGVMLDADTSFVTTRNNNVSQIWRSRVPRRTVQALLSSPEIKIVEQRRHNKAQKPAKANPAPGQFLLSNVRGPEVLKAIVSRCSGQ